MGILVEQLFLYWRPRRRSSASSRLRTLLWRGVGLSFGLASPQGRRRGRAPRAGLRGESLGSSIPQDANGSRRGRNWSRSAGHRGDTRVRRGETRGVGCARRSPGATVESGVLPYRAAHSAHGSVFMRAQPGSPPVPPGPHRHTRTRWHTGIGCSASASLRSLACRTSHSSCPACVLAVRCARAEPRAKLRGGDGQCRWWAAERGGDPARRAGGARMKDRSVLRRTAARSGRIPRCGYPTRGSSRGASSPRRLSAPSLAPGTTSRSQLTCDCALARRDHRWHAALRRSRHRRADAQVQRECHRRGGAAAGDDHPRPRRLPPSRRMPARSSFGAREDGWGTPSGEQSSAASTTSAAQMAVVYRPAPRDAQRVRDTRARSKCSVPGIPPPGSANHVQASRVDLVDGRATGEEE